MTHQLICNMSSLSHQVRLTWGQMLTYLLKMIVHMFRCASTRGTRRGSNYVASFLASKVICEKNDFPVTAILTFVASGGLTADATWNNLDRKLRYAWELTIAFIGCRLAIVVSMFEGSFRKSFLGCTNLTFDDLWRPQHWPYGKKNYRSLDWRTNIRTNQEERPHANTW